MSKEQEVRQELHAAWARNQAVIVKFETQWCGPCRMLTQFLQGQMQRFPGTLKILRVDCEASDANREYAAAHAVQSYPTLMMYANGVLVETIRGFNQQAVVDGIERIVRLVANDDLPVPELSEQLADEMEARLGARSPADFLEASRLLVTFLRNVAVHPEEPKYRKVNTKNPRYVKHAAMLTEALLLCGFEEDGDNSCWAVSVCATSLCRRRNCCSGRCFNTAPWPGRLNRPEPARQWSLPAIFRMP